MLKSIRAKLFFLFTVSLLSVLVLSAFHVWSLTSLRERFLISERAEDMLNDILEVRRFEKNYLLYHDAGSLREGLGYLEKAETLARSMDEDASMVLGADVFEAFIRNMTAYRQTLETLSPAAVPDKAEAERVRLLGKNITSFANALLTAKRERIRTVIQRALVLPFAFVAVFMLLSIAALALVTRRVLGPLSFLRETTQRIGRGDFRPLVVESAQDNEIVQLIGAFNLMALELEANQEDLLQARKMAALGAFTAGVAHELNNPVNNISLTAEALMEDYAAKLDDEGRELLDDMASQAERAADIVRNLLDFSRTGNAGFAMLSVEETVKGVVSLVRNQLHLAGVELDLTVEEGLPPVRGNMRNLQQVFMNILLNAVQASPKGGHIRITAARDVKGCARVDIADSGPGIPEDARERIFEPFYTTKEVGKGTGLGLAVAYSLIKSHGGRIEANNAPEGGAVFSVTLPGCAGENAQGEDG